MAYGPVSIGGYMALPPATDTELGGIKVSDDFNITDDGILTLAGKKTSDIFLVGSIYITVSDVSPASIYGGTWEEIAQNRVLMGASDTHAAGTTAEAGLPNITGSYTTNRMTVASYGHLQGAFDAKASSYNADYTGADASTRVAGELNFDASRSSSIYGNSDTVQPAAYFVHIWRRVA